MRRTMVLLAGLLLLCGHLGASRAASPSDAVPPTPSAPDRGEALRDAAKAGDLGRVKSLLDSGVSANAADSRHGLTPLLFAAQGGHDDVVALLLERGADPSAAERFFGQSPLAAALEGKHWGMARMLLGRGATQASEALFAGIEAGEEDLVRLALASGRIRALELKAARKIALNSTVKGIQEALAAAPMPPSETRVVEVPAGKLARFEGRYRAQQGLEVRVAVSGGGSAGAGLTLNAPGIPEMTLLARGEGYFETAAGDVSAEFSGRAGTVEWLRVNRDGNIASFNLVTTDPVPIAKAEPLPEEIRPARAEPRPWPQFRGPEGSGVADGQGVPLRWDLSAKEGVRFRTPIPGIALSSPIAWGDRIFVTTAISSKGDTTFRTGLYGDGSSVDDRSTHSFRLLALDAKSGAIVWDREVVSTEPTVRRHLKSSLANATPVTDGRRVIVLFGAVGTLAAYDFSGGLLWKRDIGVLDCNDPQAGAAEWGHASSPILYEGMVLVQADRRRDSFLAAYRAEDGRDVWRVARDESSTWATPGILPASTGAELITNGRSIRAYSPLTGESLWSLSPNSEVVVATPVMGEGMVFLTAGYPPIRPIYAVKPGHRGDLSLPEGSRRSDAVAWSQARGGTYIPTPILYRGHLYLINNNGVVTCHRADTGEQVYQTRLGEAGASFSASPIAADGRLYFASETGEVYVLRAGAGHELLATNVMNETVMATPAASGGLLLVRTLGHLVALQN